MLTIILFGGIGYKFLGVREFPVLTRPLLLFVPVIPGLTRMWYNLKLPNPRKAINGIDGIRSISASSNQGSSIITVEFNLSSNLEAAANDKVRDKVSGGAAAAAGYWCSTCGK